MRASAVRQGAGAWLKDRRSGPDGEHNVAVHVRSASHGSALQGIRIFEFDANGALQQRIAAERGEVDAKGTWQLAACASPAGRPAGRTRHRRSPTRWPTSACPR